MLGNQPVKFEFNPIAIDLPCDREELNRYISLVATPGPNEVPSPSRSRQLHTGRLITASGETPEWIVRRRTPLADQIKLRPDDFLLTWRGLETSETDAGKRSEHRDQTLSALADLHVELISTIEARDKTLRVADLLATSIGEFHLDQQEISWTASAYASYLPPQTVWWNRYGEEFSFDTLVQEMMTRTLDRESCRGLHLVMALTKILRIDRESIVLSPEVRNSLNAYVRGKLAESVESQLEDGSWPLLWSRSGYDNTRESTPEDSNINRLIVTGHMLEWFHMLPDDLKPPIHIVQAGSHWLLEALRSASGGTINKEFCPYTHAVLSLYLARFPE